MTIEELSVRITAEAEDALAVLDEVTQRLTALDELLHRQIYIGLDGEATSETLTQLEEQLTVLQERLAQQSQTMAESIRLVPVE